MTEAQTDARFACDICGRTHGWKPQYAGRKFMCACGQEMFVPASPEVDKDGLYEIADDPSPKPRVNVPVSTTPDKVGEGAVAPPVALKVEPILYQNPMTPGSSELDRLFPDKVKDLYLPLWLIGGGTVIEIISLIISTWGRGWAFRQSVRALGIDLVVVTGINLVAILIARKVRHINFGPLRVAIMKLCAVVIGASALGQLVGTIPLLGIFAGLIVAPVAYFALLGALFDLDESDTWYCVGVSFLVWLFVYGATHKVV
jgi:hypothetical protein